jgi:hypothetical protein
MSARPFAVGGWLPVPSVYIAAEPGRVGQALPVLAAGDRVAQGGKLQAQRLQFERRLRLYGPEVATVNSSLELTVGSSSRERPTVTRALTVAARRGRLRAADLKTKSALRLLKRAKSPHTR